MKKYANQCGWSDVHPYEVVGSRGKGLVIRAMKVGKRLNDPVFVVGGFAGHCVNNHAIEHEIHSYPESPEFVIRPSKKLPADYMRDKHGNRYHLSDKPVYHYDYNF